MQRPIPYLLAALALSMSVLGGCAQNISPDTYSVGSVGQVNRVVRGTIISARPVQIAGTQGLGGTTGAAAGAIAGSTIGGSSEANLLGAIGGAVIGGLAGAAIERGATRQQGIEYVVEAENKALLTVVQGQEPPLAVGQRVLVMYGQQSRIIPDQSAQ